jgi:hypothetical protein
MSKGCVTFKNEGRLGNYLFECATALAYARRHAMGFTTPSRTNNSKWNPLYFPWLVNDDCTAEVLPKVIIRELSHAYHPLPFKEKYRDCHVILEGYFQSFKYFEEYRNEILTAFDLPWKKLDGFIGIHIRRGDYLQYPKKHILQSPEWLRECVYYFVERGYKSFVVCSDGLPWAKETLNPLRVSGAEFSYSENHDEIQDIALLSCCEHMICSSSTFGLWAGWLNQNPNKIILIPDKWFGPGEKLPTRDIVPDNSNWIKIPI